MNTLRTSSLSLFLGLAACSGGGGGTSTAAPATAGSVHVALDTATGTGTVVQFVVGGAVLQHVDGRRTDDVLATPTVVTFTDPSGQLSYLRLQNVPAGDYATLELMLQPGTGVQRTEDGQQHALSAPLALSLPIGEALHHDGSTPSWLVVGHAVANTVQGTGAGATFAPQLTARADGSRHDVDGLRTARLEGERLFVRQPGADDGVLEVEFADGCECSDDSHVFASRGEFLQGLGSDDVTIDGELARSGRLRAHRAHRSTANDNPRLFGRIQALDAPTSSFTFRIEWQERHGQRTLLAPPVDVRVLTQGARLEAEDAHTTLTFGQLVVGQRAKVAWTTRTPVAGGLDDVTAREVEVGSGSGVALQPEWEGRVQSVDIVAGTVLVQRRGDDPILVNGVSVATVLVTVDANTVLRRAMSGGGGDVAIGLAALVAGQDRIWWRGTVTGPQAITATWLRVRTD